MPYRFARQPVEARITARAVEIFFKGERITAEARHDLLEILEERYARHSTIVTSQLPVEKWHEVIGNPT